ncbi:replication initiator protein [Sigmofec virus UA08Rod_6521]|uniref:Replication initiator protein n=1 Tax=Sigmofec virus UA08Rod_6521 TaxID=2929233 RepID=A0A976R7V3_9VIRU|nr:replication initiator protein [Sigmofec virus UA08Rod_6521]
MTDTIIIARSVTMDIIDDITEFYELRDSEVLYFIKDNIRVTDWQYRVGYELMCHEDNCVVTLTYDNEHLPLFGSLNHRDFQLFMKSLRKRISPAVIKYFGCGEYGAHGFRPHFHFICFGWTPTDAEYFFTDEKGTRLYKSAFLSSIWKRGYITVCKNVTPRIVRYCCKYLQKGGQAPAPGLNPPYLFCSRRPGVGATLPVGLVDWENDKIYYDGRSRRIPRYYLSRAPDSVVADLKQRRNDWTDYFNSFFPVFDEQKQYYERFKQIYRRLKK